MSERMKMTKRLFTSKEQKQIKCNPYVQAVSEKAITYSCKCQYRIEPERSLQK
jgi:hypothetical protein